MWSIFLLVMDPGIFPNLAKKLILVITRKCLLRGHFLAKASPRSPDTGGSHVTRFLGPQKNRVIGEVFKYYLLIKRAPRISKVHFLGTSSDLGPCMIQQIEGILLIKRSSRFQSHGIQLADNFMQKLL